MIWPQHFYVKRDCLLFSLNVKVFFAFVMREKANYLCVKLFPEEVKGTLRKKAYVTYVYVYTVSGKEQNTHNLGDPGAKF